MNYIQYIFKISRYHLRYYKKKLKIKQTKQCAIKPRKYTIGRTQIGIIYIYNI